MLIVSKSKSQSIYFVSQIYYLNFKSSLLHTVNTMKIAFVQVIHGQMEVKGYLGFSTSNE